MKVLVLPEYVSVHIGTLVGKVQALKRVRSLLVAQYDWRKTLLSQYFGR